MKIDYPRFSAGRAREDIRARFGRNISGYWKLGEDLFDRSLTYSTAPTVIPHHGTATGTTLFPGKLGLAHHIDGTSASYIQLGQPDLNSRATISFWINFDDLTTNPDAYGMHHILGKTINYVSPGTPVSIEGTWHLAYADDTAHVSYRNRLLLWFRPVSYPISASVKISGPIALMPGRWHHIAVVVDMITLSGNKSQFYLDGVPVGIGTNNVDTNWAAFSSTQNAYLRIGYGTPNDNTYSYATNYSSFAGYVQELAILRYMLSQDQVRDYYTALAKAPPPENPIIYHLQNTDIKITESVTLADSLDRQAIRDVKLPEELDLTDSVSSPATRTRVISEELGLTDALDWDDHIYVYVKEELDLTDSLERSVELNKKITETVGLSDDVSRQINVTAAISETLSLTDATEDSRTQQISETLDLTDSILGEHARIFFNFNLYNEIETNHIFYSESTSNSITAPIFMVKNFYGTAHRFSHNILTSRFLSRRLRNNLVSHNYLFITKRFGNNLIPDATVTSLQPQYKITLDGVDVTDLVESCNINYSLGSFCGEVDITWADYTLFTDLDISNTDLNYKQERLVVYTRLNSNETPTWMVQGRFFLEKRGTTVGASSIVPTSWGRTKPALLSLPYAKPLTKVWTTDTSAQAIVRSICRSAGVSVVWEVTDYPILAGNLTADGTEPISLISQLAGVVGGVLTCGTDGTLYVKYRYNLSAKNESTFVSLPETPEINSIVGGDQQAMVYFS
jgi:hypothetical protein